jgi:hypothetical protein
MRLVFINEVLDTNSWLYLKLHLVSNNANSRHNVRLLLNADLYESEMLLYVHTSVDNQCS